MYFPFILPTTSYIGLMHGINNIKDKSNNYKNLNNIKYILKNTSCGLAIGILYPVGIPIFSYYYLKSIFFANNMNNMNNK
jgi:NADH:ubiquinone oxidoreductase subunit 5 (subunit L)/multisubunit Na+/H+ antiporter MnhA subunit